MNDSPRGPATGSVDPLAAAGLKLADGLVDAARRTRDGGWTWLGPVYGDPGTVRPLGLHLYGGVPGVALFLAAAHRFRSCAAPDPGDRYRKAARAALAPLRRRLSSVAADPAKVRDTRPALGGLQGLGSWIYAFALSGGLLDDEELVREAAALATWVTPERLTQDGAGSLAAGSAGLALALLALHRQAPEGAGDDRRSPLDRAVQCAARLVELQARDGETAGGWRTLPDTPPLTGFAHGAAGITYSLARVLAMAEAEGVELGPSVRAELERAIRDGLAYERRHFSPRKGNWRDLRVREERYLELWCHGAPGIVLGRLGLPPSWKDATLRREVEAGLATTQKVGLEPLDDLCCGNAGRAEVLVEAGRRSGRGELEEAGRAETHRALERARARASLGRGDGWGLHPLEQPEVLNPSLFQGVSGIGYHLLRLADPRALPCLLRLDPLPSPNS